jgi:O-antigen/teichoic acid export membrane protein
MGFLNSARSRLLRSPSLRNTGLLTLGTVFSQGIAVAGTPLLSRLFTPSDFGALAIFTSVIAVVATCVTLRYEINILVPKADAEAEKLVILSIFSALVLGSLITLASWCLPSAIADSWGIKLSTPWLPLACLAGTVSSINAVLLLWLNRKLRYQNIATVKVIQSLIATLFALILGFCGFQEGLLAAQLLSVLCALFFVGRYLPSFLNTQKRPVLKAAIKYKSTVKYVLPTAVIDVLTLQLPILMIAAMWGASSAGQFSLAWRVLILPASILGTAIGQVFFQRFSIAWPDSKLAWTLVVRTWKFLALVGILPLLIIIFFGQELFSLAFGSTWTESGKIASVLAPMMFASLLHSPTSTSYIVLGLQKPVFFLSLAVMVYRPASLWIGWKLGSLSLGLAILCIMEVLQILCFQYMVYKKVSERDCTS